MKHVFIILIVLLTSVKCYPQATGYPLPNFTANGPICTAVFINSNTLINVNQTTAGIVLTMPIPTDTTAGKNISVTNNSNSITGQPFLLIPAGYIYPGRGVILRWVKNQWAITGGYPSSVVMQQNTFYATPSATTGMPSFRSIVEADLPASGATPGTWNNVTVNSQGFVTAGSNTGYLTTETDPTVSAGIKAITGTNITNWNTAFAWGNHAGLYPLLASSYNNPSWISALAYSKLTGAPTLATVATSGAYTDLTGKPTLATVATSGAYTDLSGRPSLATVATSGSYNDLSSKPTIPSAQVSSDWSSVISPTQILNKPTIPTNTNQLTNGSGFISANQTITLSGSVSGSGTTAITTTLSSTGVSAGTYEFVTVGVDGRITAAYNTAKSALPARTLGTAYQASNTGRIYAIQGTVSILIGATLISSSNGQLTLEISANGSTGWVEHARSQNANSGVLAAQNTQVGYIEADEIPAGYYYRFLFTQVAGTASGSVLGGWEVLKR